MFEITDNKCEKDFANTTCMSITKEFLVVTYNVIMVTYTKSQLTYLVQ